MTKKNLVDTLVDSSFEKLDLFRNVAGVAYGEVKRGGPDERFRIDSPRFQAWLQRHARESLQQCPNRRDVEAVQYALHLECQQKPTHEVAIRTAWLNNCAYIDLGTKEFVEVSRTGWRLIETCPVKFIRTPTMRQLPKPEASDSCEFLAGSNVSEDERRLIKSWCVSAFFANIAHPVLFLIGEQGASKTTTAKLIRSLVDPAQPEIYSMPKTERNFAVQAMDTWVSAFDNVSSFSDAQQDMLCRAVTGAGFSERKLYCDADIVTFEIQKPIIITAIGLPLRDDLRDRSLLIELAQIKVQDRRTDEEIWRNFRFLQPAWLAHIFDAMSAALKNASKVQTGNLPRMADYAAYSIAAEEALGWQPGGFLNAFQQNQRNSMQVMLSSSSLAHLLIPYIKKRHFWGTMTELMQYLEAMASYRPGLLPRNPQLLSIELKKLIPALREIGITVEFTRGDDRKYLIYFGERPDE